MLNNWDGLLIYEARLQPCRGCNLQQSAAAEAQSKMQTLSLIQGIKCNESVKGEGGKQTPKSDKN